MRSIYFKIVALVGMCVVSSVQAAGSGFPLQPANIDPTDQESLRSGAQTFADFCLNCHSLSLMRYNRVAKDLGLPETEIESRMIFTGAKTGDTMDIAMKRNDAKRWFGTNPPDLSVVARARGVDWIYTYLRSFYQDPSRPWGVNNAVFKDVAMPNIFWQQQGEQSPKFNTVVDSEGFEHQVISELTPTKPGSMSPEQFDKMIRDLTNFLHYVGEPAKQQRLALGKWVLIYLAIFFVVVLLLKKEFWRDVK